MPIALERLREVTDVDRCHLFENHLAADGVLRASLRYEAMAEGISSKLGEDDVTNVPWDPQYEHWARALSFGEPVHGPAPEVRAMAGDAEMEPGTGTLAMLPLHVGQQWHGVLAFSTEDSAREWSHQQMQLLGTAAATISAAIGRVQGDRAVQEGLHLEQQIVDAIPTPVFYKDAERRYLGSNRAFQEIMGRSKEDIEGRTAAEVTPDKNTIGHDEADDRVFGGPSTEVYETRVLAADGTSLDMVIHKAPFRNVDGNVAGLVGIAMDITERKAQEAAVEESERKYRELVENANSIILRLDPEGRITFFNEFAQQFFGYSEDEILGRHVVGSIAPEIDSSGRDLREMVDDALANPEEYGTNENENITKDGKRVLVAWRNKPILSEDGEYVGMTAVGTDVTEQRAAEEDARLFRELVNQSFDAVFIVDAPSGVLLDCNDRASMAFGYSREELLEMELLDLDATVEVDFSWQGGVEILKDSSGIVRETVYRRKDGSTLPVEVSLRHITSDARDYIVAVARDVSERKKLEQQLAQAAKMEAVGQLAGGVAHDFNNILTGISGYTDFVLANLAPDSTAHEDLTHVRGLADRASSLTRQLLAFSRRQTMEPTTLQVNMLIENLLKMLGRLVGEDIQLEFKPDATLGTCRADPAQIEQVVINLAVNARDAMPEGGRLTISATNAVVDRELSPDVGPGEYVLISVRDTGQGMDEDTSSRIFEPFFTTKEIGSGTGLGLAMVYGIVEQHGGHVEVESALGEGSVFRVYLARSDGADPEVEEDVDPGGPGRGTILFVEDDVEIQPIIRRILTSRGYEVLVASSPSEAEALFDKRQADISLLLTDVVMPESTGMALYQTLARKRADLRVLYTSGYTPEEIAKRGELDADAPFLQKPFTGAELARKVRGLLEEST